MIKHHSISTDSEFSPNDLLLFEEEERNYYPPTSTLARLLVEHDLALIQEEKDKAAVAKLDLMPNPIRLSCSLDG